MTCQETLASIARLRNLGRAERVERARKFTEDYQHLASEIKNGLAWEDVDAEMQEFLLSCSQATYLAFERLVQCAPRTARGHKFTSPRKAS